MTLGLGEKTTKLHIPPCLKMDEVNEDCDCDAAVDDDDDDDDDDDNDFNDDDGSGG